MTWANPSLLSSVRKRKSLRGVRLLPEKPLQSLRRQLMPKKPPTTKQEAAYNAAVGRRLRERRTNGMMTLVDLGKRSGFSVGQLSRYENGKSSMGPATLIALADALECRPSDFLDGLRVKP